MRFTLSVISLIFGLLFSLSASALNFSLKSPDFVNKNSLPVLHTCDGKDVSPELIWSGAPEKALSFALLFSDPDAPNGTFYHWILFNIPVKTNHLSAGIKQLPEGTIVGKNSFNKIQYNGPCPPLKNQHHYIFTLYALDNILNLNTGADAKAVLEAIQEHVLQKTELFGTYSRQ